MIIDVIHANATEHDRLLRNLYQFYLYEFSRFTTEWRVQEDGRFEESDLEDCWEDEHRLIFLLHSYDGWVGFAIIDRGLPNSDGSTVHELAEFFIMPPYRLQGIGERIACSFFDKFKGAWKLTIVETNVEALHFWRAVLGRYTAGEFTEQHRPEEEDYLHTFHSR